MQFCIVDCFLHFFLYRCFSVSHTVLYCTARLIACISHVRGCVRWAWSQQKLTRLQLIIKLRYGIGNGIT